MRLKEQAAGQSWNTLDACALPDVFAQSSPESHPVWIPGGKGKIVLPASGTVQPPRRTSASRQEDLVTCGSHLRVRIQPATIRRPIRGIGGDDIKPTEETAGEMT